MDCDVVVVGAGLAGAAAAWALTGRGHSVVLLEAQAWGHDRGSSHGSSRIYRRAYADPFYVDLTGRSDAHWARLESEAAVQLRFPTGEIDSGPGRDLAAMARELRTRGVAAELLTADDAESRWPGMHFAGDVLHHDAAGYLNADATMAACIDVARSRGAMATDRTPVVAIEQSPTGVLVQTAARSFTAGAVVVAAGAWLPELLPRIDLHTPALQLTVKQQEVFHFRHRDPLAAWPTLIHKGDVELYGLPSGSDGGSVPAMKIGQFDSESATSASGRDGVVDPRARRVVRRFAERWLPGLDPEPVAEQSCLFTMTPDEDFVLDRDRNVVVASPCSGHGAKFAPLVGALITDLVEGRPALPRFAFR